MVPGMDEFRDKERGRQQMFLSVRYYRAVRDLGPVWELEDMRLTELYSEHTSVSAADALVYAIVHDHRVYAKYLLHHFPDSLTEARGRCSCPAAVMHVMLSVRYDRMDILNLLLEVSQQLPDPKAELVLGGCVNSDNGKTPLHVACELQRVGMIVTLLRHGARAQAADRTGGTPVDVLLDHLQNPTGSALKKRRCLEILLMFISNARFKMKGVLMNEPDYWTRVIGQRSYDFLVGKTPPTLAILSMRSILQQIPSKNFLYRLNALPIPVSLKASLDICTEKPAAGHKYLQ